MGMDRNTLIGLTLIFVLFIVWQQFFIGPEQQKQAALQRRTRDSIALAERRADSVQQLQRAEQVRRDSSVQTTLSDSAQVSQLGGKFGGFTRAAIGEEQLQTLENDVFKLTFSNKGGQIVKAELKKYQKVSENEKKKEVKSPLILFDNPKNKFAYALPVSGAAGGVVSTDNLYFTANQTANSITFRADAGNGQYFEQKYTITPGKYTIDYTVQAQGLNASEIKLNWNTHLNKLEKNTHYERQYSTVYFKPTDSRYSYCSYTSDDTENYSTQPLKWISHANQFFNTSLVAKSQFKGGVLTTQQFREEAPDLKRVQSEVVLPLNSDNNYTFGMDFYVGPNEFRSLRALGSELEDVIPFGWGIFGTINRWVIRPIFDFLSTFIGSKGIVILMLTLIVKLLLYPLSYRMLYSQAKMGALKPQLEGLKDKFKDDPQALQMEQMKIYREFGVNPLGGCLPMLAQMPIWFALYRFFPAAIEFRQAGFLWATDLSSYDVFVQLPFEIPLGFGSHISLFTLLWAVTTLIYTYYSTRHMDMSANPAMKYMQYIMPVMFLGFFNSFASGLTCYLLFSNIINIGQTIVTKNFIIDEKKIMALLEENRKKPKKKGGFQERLEIAMKEQERLRNQRQQQQAKAAKAATPATTVKKKPTGKK